MPTSTPLTAPIDKLGQDPAFTQIVGSNSYRYFGRWRSMFARSGTLQGVFSTPSWNWAAFFLTYFWQFYRGLIGRGLIYLVASILVIFASLVGSAVSPTYGVLGVFGLLICNICAAITANAAVFTKSILKHRLMGHKVDGMTGPTPGAAPLLIIDLVPLICAGALSAAAIFAIGTQYEASQAGEPASVESSDAATAQSDQQANSNEYSAPTITAEAFTALTAGRKIERLDLNKQYAQPVNVNELSPEAINFARSISGLWLREDNKAKCSVLISMVAPYEPYLSFHCISKTGQNEQAGIWQIYNMQFDNEKSLLAIHTVANGAPLVFKGDIRGSVPKLAIVDGALPGELSLVRRLTNDEAKLLSAEIIQ